MRSRKRDQRPTSYRVVVRGEVEETLAPEIDHRSIESSDGVTTMVIDVRDSSHLEGILDRLRDLHMDIVSAEALGQGGEPRPSG